MRLTYWIAHCLNDSPVYSIRERTRALVKLKLSEPDVDVEGYSKPMKVSIEYSSALDLLKQVLSEGGALHENRADVMYERTKFSQ